MIGRKWTFAFAVLFSALLVWYLFYTERIVRALRTDAEVLTRIYAEVQTGIADTTAGAALSSLVELQRMIVSSGLPLVVTGSADTILYVENLPFDADPATRSGQIRVQEYVRGLGTRRPPIGDVTIQAVHFGDPPEVTRLRWIPWLQAGGMALTVLIGFALIRIQRRAESERAWTAMARELAHQLGTPLSALQGWLELLRLEGEDRPEGLGDFEIAAEMDLDLQRLERVSRRFELIGRDPRLEPISVLAIMREMESYIQARLPRLGRGRAVELGVELPQGLPTVLGSEVLLSWALENVVKNALDALAGRGGRITIEAESGDSPWIVIRVRDTGPGVDPLVRDRIFEPGVSTKSGGWGVGLALSRRIVEGVHRGRIELLESGLAGTIIQVKLPAVRDIDDPPDRNSGRGTDFMETVGRKGH